MKEREWEREWKKERWNRNESRWSKTCRAEGGKGERELKGEAPSKGIIGERLEGGKEEWREDGRRRDEGNKCSLIPLCVGHVEEEENEQSHSVTHGHKHTVWILHYPIGTLSLSTSFKLSHLLHTSFSPWLPVSHPTLLLSFSLFLPVFLSVGQLMCTMERER